MLRRQPNEMGAEPERFRDRAASWALAGAWGIAMAWGIANQVAVNRVGVPLFVALVVVTALLLMVLSHGLFSWSWRRLEGRRRGVWLIISLIAGCLMTLAIPVDLLAGVPDNLFTPGTLEVVATGERNPESQATEVWILDVVEDGEPVDLATLVRDGSWELREGALLSATQGGSDSVSWTETVEHGASLILLSHSHSGIADVSWGGRTKRIDLYDPEGTQRVIELAPAPGPILYPLSLFAAFSLGFGLIVLVLSVWLVFRTRTTPTVAASTDHAFQLEAGVIAPELAGRGSSDQREPWRDKVTRQPGRRAWLAYASPPALIWSVYLLAFWPGLLSVDSIIQWGQILAGHFNDWHPAFHTMSGWLLTRLVLSPAVVAGAQIVILSGIIGWALATMRRLGLPGVAAWVISVVVAVWPPNGVTVITLWKDVPYAIGILTLGVIILREVDGRLSILDQRLGWARVGGVAALVALYHHAGIYVATGSLIALGIATRRRAVIAAASIAVLAVAMVQGGLYNAVGVSGSGHPGIDGVVFHHIGAHLEDETPMTDRDLALLADLVPTRDIEWYNCESLTPMVLDSRFDMGAIHDMGSEARSAWLTLMLRNPSADFEHVLCNSSLVWRIRVMPGKYQLGSNLFVDENGEYATIAKNDSGLQLRPVIPALTESLANLIRQSELPPTGWLWWRGPVYLYLVLFGAAVAALRSGDRRYWAVAIPSILVGAILTVAAPAQDFRYMYPVVLTGMVVGPYLLFGVPRRDPPPEGGATEALPSRLNASQV